MPIFEGLKPNTLVCERDHPHMITDFWVGRYSRVSNKRVGWNKRAGGIKLPIFGIF